MLVINFTRVYEMNQILFVAKRNAERVILKEKVAVEKDAQRMVKSVARVVLSKQQVANKKSVLLVDFLELVIGSSVRHHANLWAI